MSVTDATATLDDLARVKSKAELIAGGIVHFLPTGRLPNRVAARIFRSLDDYAEATGRGEAYTDNAGFAVPELRSGRQSSSPDAAYYVGRFPRNPMRFIQGAPTLAVEVRSEDDYGAAAEAELARVPSGRRRADYFEAGTLVVWDVDPLGECVRAYRRDSPGEAAVFQRGQVADAEPAAPGWRISVDVLFRPVKRNE